MVEEQHRNSKTLKLNIHRATLSGVNMSALFQRYQRVNQAFGIKRTGELFQKCTNRTCIQHEAPAYTVLIAVLQS